MSKPSFDEALRQLDQALQRLETAAPETPVAPEQALPEAVVPEAPPPLSGEAAAPAPPGPRPRGRRRFAARRGARRSAGAGAPTLPPADAPALRLSEAGALPEPGAPPPPTEALLRLVVGAALLGLDGLAARAGAWEAAAGISRPAGSAPGDAEQSGAGRFRHALIGWLFEAEAHLRPRGNPIAWLRAVVAYLFGTVFSVVIEMLPLPRFGGRRGRRAGADPSDEDTRRWVSRGLAEEAPSRRFARAALEDLLHRAIIYAAERPAVAQALVAIVRSPAMDEAVEHIVAGPVVERAIERVAASPELDTVIDRVAASPKLDTVVARVAASPELDTVVARVAASPELDTVIDRVAASSALDGAIGKIVRAPAMEEAITYLAETPAMDQAIATLSQNPALADLVRSQSGSLARDILNDVRSAAIQGDQGLENLARRLLRRPPRASLPHEARGLLVAETRKDPDA